MIELTFLTTKPSTALERSTADATFFSIQTETIEISQTEENKTQIGITWSSYQNFPTQRCLFFPQGADQRISTLLSNQSYDTVNCFPAMRHQSIFTGRSRYRSISTMSTKKLRLLRSG